MRRWRHYTTALGIGAAAALSVGLAAVPTAAADTCTISVENPDGSLIHAYPNVTVPSGTTDQTALLQALVDSGAVPVGTYQLGDVTLVNSCVTTTSTTTTTTTTTTTSPPATSSSTTTSTTTAPPPPLPAPAPPASTTGSSSSTTTQTHSTTTSGLPPAARRAGAGQGANPVLPPAAGAGPQTSTSSTTTRSAPSHRRTRHRRHRHHSSRSSSTSTSTTQSTPLQSPANPANPNSPFSLSFPGSSLTGVPNFFIDSFQIPPFLLPIYQAAGIEYQVPWQVLAAINQIETDYGRNLSISSAGAEGWMQFMPSTWKRWGVDANGDGVADPYNPVDAIFSAARYLHAAGATQNISRAIFAYNHAGWYVESVLLRAKLIGGVPASLIGALSGMVQGRFPVAAKAHYADDSVVAMARRRARVTDGNAAEAIDSDHTTGTAIYAKRGAQVVAVNDGKIVRIGHTAALGNYVALQDSTGNTFTYAHLGSIATRFASPKPVAITKQDIAQQLATVRVSAPRTAASAGDQARPKLRETRSAAPATDSAPGTSAGATPTPAHPATHGHPSPAAAPMVKERLFAHPARHNSYAAGGNRQIHDAPAITNFDDYFADALHLGRNQYTLKRLRVGSIVVGGTVLGRIGGRSQGTGPHVFFEVQPAGRRAPHIDPKPILDGWRLLQATAVYRSRDSAFAGPNAKNPSVGQILLMSKQQLIQRTLTDPNVRIYACGRRDIEAGTIDRRVLGVIEFLAASGLKPTVSGLACDASANGSTGVDAAGKTGESVDISAINGIPVLGHQGPGSITALAIRRLLTLQGSMTPDEIVSDMAFKGQSNTIALPDHRNRIQVSFASAFGANAKASRAASTILRPGQWTQLIRRIGQIPEPVVPINPSRYAIKQSRTGR